MKYHSVDLHIETERLILRPFELSDIEASFQMNLDKEVSKYTGDGGVVDMAEMERRIKGDVLGDYAKYGFGRLAVSLKETGKFIGFAGLKYLEDFEEVDLGYRFMSAYWGMGLATEAGKACIKFGFESLKLNEIVAFVLPENIGSIRVLEKLGFKYDSEILEEGELARKFILIKSSVTE